MGRFHTPFLTDQVVFPASKFIPENHCSNSAQVKIKEPRIISTFDLAASKNDSVKGSKICSKNGGFHCSYNLKYSLSVDSRFLFHRSLRLQPF